MNKSQKEFEVWFYNDLNEAAGVYHLAWQAWQASRSALVVNLPVTVCRTHVYEVPFTNEVGMEHDEYFEVDEIKMALDSVGVKYK